MWLLVSQLVTPVATYLVAVAKYVGMELYTLHHLIMCSWHSQPAYKGITLAMVTQQHEIVFQTATADFSSLRNCVSRGVS